MLLLSDNLYNTDTFYLKVRKKHVIRQPKQQKQSFVNSECTEKISLLKGEQY